MTSSDTLEARDTAKALILARVTVVAVSQDEAYQKLTVEFRDHEARMAFVRATPSHIGLDGEGLRLEIDFPHTSGDLVDILQRPYRVIVRRTYGQRGDEWESVAVYTYSSPAAAAQMMYHARRKMDRAQATATAPSADGGREFISERTLGKLYAQAR